MKKVIRYVGIGFGLLLIGIGGLLAFVKFGMPGTTIGDAPDLKIAVTAAKIDRGRYLANHVNACIDCHSTRDWSRFAGPPMPGTHGKGGERFGREMGLPGDIYARNITPAGLESWTDGEIFRAITAGVNKDGRALFPLMPHPKYGQMDPADVEAIIAYLRTLTPVSNNIPDASLDFPMNFIVNTIPQKPDFQKRPDTTDQVGLGKYLVNAAACADCHTKTIKGEPVPGMDFAGGTEMVTPMGTLRPANITPDTETGIGRWTKEAFVARFKAYDPAKGFQAHKVAPGELQTIMPWTMYGGMNESDLGAIYAYLQSLKPVKNKVITFVPPSTKPALAAK